MPLNSTSADALWLATLRAAGRAPKTLEGYEYAVGQLRQWRTDDDLTTVTKLEAMQFVRWLLDNYKAAGVQSRVKRLRALWSWMVTEELVSENVFAKVRVSVPDEEQPAVGDEMVTTMLARAKRGRNARRDTALILLLCDTGCRKRELSCVEMGDVNLNDGTIRFRVSKTKPRTVPLTDRCVVAVGRWLRQRGVGSGSLWNVSDTYGLIKMVCQRHSGGAVTPHQFRRRFAVNFLLRGGSESSLMRLCGWSSAEMARLYSRSSADQIAHQEFRRLMA